MTARRLHSGGRIDRDQLLQFSFDNKWLLGYRGDTLASALLASNETVHGPLPSVRAAIATAACSSGTSASGVMVVFWWLSNSAMSCPCAKYSTRPLP